MTVHPHGKCKYEARNVSLTVVVMKRSEVTTFRHLNPRGLMNLCGKFDRNNFLSWDRVVRTEVQNRLRFPLQRTLDSEMIFFNNKVLIEHRGDILEKVES